MQTASNLIPSLASKPSSSSLSSLSPSIPSASVQASSASVKQEPQSQSIALIHDTEDDHESSFDEGDDNKRPRLRLARACDRCKRRKIKCDTNSPCSPCIAAKQACTFNTPLRRSSKPRTPSDKPRKNVKDLEARMAFLEQQLRQVPPHIHNAALSQLDASLINPSMKTPDAATSPNAQKLFVTPSSTLLGKAGPTNMSRPGLQTPFEGVSPGAYGFTFTPPSGGPSVGKVQNGWTASVGKSDSDGGITSLIGSSKAAQNGMDRLEKEMNAMDLSPGFIYLDEVGMTKWQGATSGFPLLERLAEAELHPHHTKRQHSHCSSASPECTTAWSGTPVDTEHPPSSGEKPKALRQAVSSPNTFNTSPLSGGPFLSSSVPTPSGSIEHGAEYHSFTTSHSEDPSAFILRGRPPNRQHQSSPPTVNSASSKSNRSESVGAIGGLGGLEETGVGAGEEFFPGRKPRQARRLNPEASWKVITAVIEPSLMDTLIRSYLSTTHLLWPFLHVPSFLADYANPSRWGEPGFSRFIVAVCTLSSRHVDDPRVRTNPDDPGSAGQSYLELFKKMQDLPSADRPTLYSIQANFLAAIYCMGLGTLSKAFMLFAESITMAIDGGLHRDVGGYDIFNPIEREVRKRTFWSIYCWDKQSGACFGRPAMIHLRDCDVTEPVILDDEYIRSDGLGDQPENSKSRICAFVAAIRAHVVLEGVLDGSVRPSTFSGSPFLSRAAQLIAKRQPKSEDLEEEEALLNEWSGLLEPYWAYNPETIASKDPIRITQAERLHCLENLIKMLIYRHRFSGNVLSAGESPEEHTRNLEYCRTAMSCALAIVADHLHISQRGFMTYYGVHVVHQLAQAGRTLLAVILNCKSPESRSISSASLEGFKSCVGLLRRFSGRYLCGLRSADILEEFCRICKVPIDLPQVPDPSKPSPAWLRPVRRHRSASPSRSSSTPGNTSLSPGSISNNVPPGSNTNKAPSSNLQQTMTTTTTTTTTTAMDIPTPDIFETVDFLSPPMDETFNSASTTNNVSPSPQPPSTQMAQAPIPASSSSNLPLDRDDESMLYNNEEFFDLTAAASPPSPSNEETNGSLLGPGTNVNGFNAFGDPVASMIFDDFDSPMQGVTGPDLSDLGLPSAGMDSLIGGGITQDNLSASEILQLLEQGVFDYSAIFPDQSFSS